MSGNERNGLKNPNTQNNNNNNRNKQKTDNEQNAPKQSSSLSCQFSLRIQIGQLNCKKARKGKIQSQPK